MEVAAERREECVVGGHELTVGWLKPAPTYVGAAFWRLSATWPRYSRRYAPIDVRPRNWNTTPRNTLASSETPVAATTSARTTPKTRLTPRRCWRTKAPMCRQAFATPQSSAAITI